MKYPSDSDDFMVHIISVQYTFQKWNRKMRYLCTSFHQLRYPSWTRFGTLIKHLNISVEQIYWWLLVKINLDLIVGQTCQYCSIICNKVNVYSDDPDAEDDDFYSCCDESEFQEPKGQYSINITRSNSVRVSYFISIAGL